MRSRAGAAPTEGAGAIGAVVAGETAEAVGVADVPAGAGAESPESPHAASVSATAIARSARRFAMISDDSEHKEPDMRGDDLTGKVALVIGAVRKPGIGRATCLRLAEMGAAVVCADTVVDETVIDPRGDTTKVSEAALREVVHAVEAAGGRAVAAGIEPDNRESVDNAIRRTVMEFGRLDIMCHLGGGTSPERDRPIMQLDDDAWLETVGLIYNSVFFTNQAAARQMIEQGDGGAIVNLGSFAGVKLGSGPAAFSAAKVGAEAFTRILARELAPYGIRVNMVHPLGVDTGDGIKNPGLARAAAAAGRSVDEWMRDMIPAGRFQSPDETAAVIAFLCSGAASFTSGQAISVAGAAI